MLSLFPELFTYGLLAPAIIRLAVGIFFILQGIRRQKQDAFQWNSVWNEKKIGNVTAASILAKVQIVLGIMLAIGLFTQAVAILGIIFIWATWFMQSRIARPPFQELWMNVFQTTMLISLIFLGAGFLAFDLPL